MRCAHNNIETESPCLACEIERLQAEVAKLRDIINRAKAVSRNLKFGVATMMLGVLDGDSVELLNNRLQAENARLREALGFYADPTNWRRLGELQGSPLYGVAASHRTWFVGPHTNEDGGEIARAALAPKEEADG